MITVIAPHARPEFAANLLENFARQTGVEARLLVVENGPAVGFWPTSERVNVIRSGLGSVTHQADAMNTGLAWLRASGNGPWARFDDDDWYAADYLAAIEQRLAARPDATVIGKRWGFVMHDEGLFEFNAATDAFTGGTLAARSADVLPFERRSDDDLDWCRRMRASGAVFAETPAPGYCYDRRSRAASRVIAGGLFESRFAWGECWAHGPQPFEVCDGRHRLEPVEYLPALTDAEIFAHLGGSTHATTRPSGRCADSSLWGS